MSSYHYKFEYIGKTNLDYNLIITSFNPDNGFKNSFLDMDPICEKSFDGGHVFSYGAKYKDTAKIEITLIKKDYTDLSVQDIRSYYKWLTGAKTDSWLNLYDENNTFMYAFLGKFISCEQYKMDGRTIGIKMIFVSVTPWAYSDIYSFEFISGDTLFLTNDHIMFYAEKEKTTNGGIKFENGIVSFSNSEKDSFISNEEGIVYIDDTTVINVENDTDELYEYIYLNMDLKNDNSSFIFIKNSSLNEVTEIFNIEPHEEIQLISKQFIVSNIPNKIFGDSFNFVWPKLSPGDNVITLYSDHKSYAKFSYRFPMKIGDCTMDL